MDPIQGFKEASAPKKAAIVAGGVGLVAGAASLAYAIKKGEVPDTFEGGKASKGVAKVKDGYKKLGAKIVETASDIKKKIFKAKDSTPDLEGAGNKAKGKIDGDSVAEGIEDAVAKGAEGAV